MSGGRQLAQRIRARDPYAARELLEQFQSRIQTMITVHLGDGDVARDLTQEVLMAVWRAIQERRIQHEDNLVAFVHGTARNVLSHHLRSSRRKPQAVDLTPDMVAILPQPTIQNTERSLLLQVALANLDPRSREILILALLEGLKSGEIAKKLGMPGAVVRQRKSRALKRMARTMKRLSRTEKGRHSIYRYRN